jgi:hypothetical protein
MTMRIAAAAIALLALGTALPAAAQAPPKVGQLEIKAYQPIPKTKTAVQLTSDSALARNLRREVMVRIARRGNEVGFSGGNVMRMDVQYIDLLGGGDITRGPVGGRDQHFDGPAANPRPEVPGIRIERGGSAPISGGPMLRITLTLYSTDGGKVLWTASASCYTQARTAETAGNMMIDSIFDQADKNRIADAGCPL